MTKKSLLSLTLAGVVLISALAGCQKAAPDGTTSGTVPTTTVPSTTESHLHLDPVVYPDTIDFNDTDALEALFDMCEITDGIKVSVEKRSQQIRMRGKVNGETFTLSISLSGAGGHTTPQQIVTCAKLFWYCYPQMYARFAIATTPTSVTLKFEDFGYEVASASGSEVHIHDQWLKNNPQDFDCLTHEFAHIIQSGWDGNYVPSYGDDTYMIERFADYCRYLYSFKRGYYNDMTWTLQTSKTENTYYKSVRFWVWLDYTYSTAEIDIMNRMQQAVTKKTYPRDDWGTDGKAWEALFKDTNAAGKTIDQLWEEFAASDMADLSSKPREQGELSSLLRTLPLRQAIRDRYPTADDYLKVQ